MTKEGYKKGDRVQKIVEPGLTGTIEEVRQEATSTLDKQDEKAFLVRVAWDNGTVSYFDPESLSKA